jgi:hypothetical protein
MGFVMTITGGLVLWIVFWATGTSGFDSFGLAAAVILIGAAVKVLSGYLPSRRS